MCALHKQKLHTNRKLYKNAKNTNFFLTKAMVSDRIYSRGCKSLMCRFSQSEALVSRKLVFREKFSEGSETTKVGTDEQKLNMRHI
ncbi:MAG: hypothetical protein DRI23_13430 [Candidatus Cloacimonadota bacterium]|nr:MAG: hypothetical protein DRI23_13430 [Candidatus Cloacimonadota bacterium]